MAFDIMNNPTFDMRSDSFLDFVKEQLRTDKNIKYVHFAPPCNTFSQACWPRVRSVARPEGKFGLHPKAKVRVRDANLVVKNMLECCHVADEEGIAVSIENPGKSYLWHMPNMKEYIAKTDASSYVIHYCRYGEEYKKPTKFVTTLHCLKTLSKTCNHPPKSHAKLSGWKDLSNKQRKMVPTKGTSPYPWALCSTWAQIVKEHLG
jgi:hypothetical protein